MAPSGDQMGTQEVHSCPTELAFVWVAQDSSTRDPCIATRITSSSIYVRKLKEGSGKV